MQTAGREKKHALIAKKLGVTVVEPDNDAITQSLVNAFWQIRPSAEPGRPIPLSEIRAYRLEFAPPFAPDELVYAIQAMDALWLQSNKSKQAR